MSRRAFLSSGAAAGVATVALGGAGAASAGADDAPADDVDAIVLQVAAAAAVFPFRVDAHEGDPVSRRLNGPHVRRAWARTSPARAEQARSGAQLLLDRKLGGAETETLLAQLSLLAAEGDERQLADLNALVAVAGATLADAVDPDSELSARIWLSTLAKMRRNGDRPTVEATR